MTRLEEVLADLTTTRSLITYGALARTLNIAPLADLTIRLETMMAADAGLGKPLRAALCRAKGPGDLPAPGFFLKAAELGFDVSDPVAFVALQRAGLFKGCE